MEFNDLFNLEEINSVLNERRDPYTKELGDRVVVNDFSSATYLNGDPIDYETGVEACFNTEFIVIETRQNISYDVHFTIYRQDLVIVNVRTDTRLRITSGHLTLK